MTMLMTIPIGALWGRYTDRANWRDDTAMNRCSLIEIGGHVVAISKGVDGWTWSVYRGEAASYSWLCEAVWSPADYPDEHAARAAAWATLAKLCAGDKWPPDLGAMSVVLDVFDPVLAHAERYGHGAP